MFWVDVNSPSSAKNDFVAIAKTLGTTAESVDEARQLLASTKKSWLLILDNADDPHFDYQVYFPSGTRGTVLITSRLSVCSRYSTVGSEELTGLDIQQSKQLLLREAAKDALYLLKALSMLNYSILPLQIFEDAWHGSRHALDADDAESSIDRLSRWHVLQLPGFMVADSDEWDSYRLIEATSILTSLSLITRHSSPGIFGLSMHPVAHAWARNHLGSNQQNQAWISTGCILALSTFAPDTWRIQERHLRPQIQSFLGIKVKTALSLGSVSVILPILLECGWILLYMRDDSRLGNFLKDIYTELEIDLTKPSIQYVPIYALDARNSVYLGYPIKAVQLLEYIVKIQNQYYQRTTMSDLDRSTILLVHIRQMNRL